MLVLNTSLYLMNLESLKNWIIKGKLIEQPEKVITEGKAKRTVHQQGDLEYNSTISKYLDKGYKKVEELFTKPLDKLSEEEINEKIKLSKVKITNKNGEEAIGKPIGNYITIDIKKLKIARRR